MYAARIQQPHAVDVYDGRTWGRLREIPTPCCSAVAYSNHTLHVTDDRILLCCRNENKLQVLSHSGELLQTHGRSRDEATHDDDIIEQTASGEPRYGPGVLDGPRLCHVDAEGSALVADTHNDRLQVTRADGTWGVVDLNTKFVQPTAAVWWDASLYVARDAKIAKYSVPAF